jgi:isocitrate dehydrogenase
MLSGAMMLKHIGWDASSEILNSAITMAYKDQKVTQDLARVLNIKPLKCSEFGNEVIKRMKPARK